MIDPSLELSAERDAGLPGLKDTDMVALNPDEQYFVDHEDELLTAYEGRFVAIRRREVVGDAGTRRELEQILARKFRKLVSVMVRQVVPGAFEFVAEKPILIS